MTELRLIDAREMCDALLFFARLENSHFESEIEDRAGHAADYRTIVLSCQAIYRTLVLTSGIRVLTTASSESYGDVPAYDATVETVELFVNNFGDRLRTLRIARGFKDPADLARKVYGSDKKSAEQRKEFANYLGRVELKNKNVGIDLQITYARALGFATLSAFWIAIERVDVTAIQDLQLLRRSADNATSSEHAQVDVHARAFPPTHEFDRIIIGAASKIVDAINNLTSRLAEILQPNPNPRAHASHRGRNPRKGTG